MSSFNALRQPRPPVPFGNTKYDTNETRRLKTVFTQVTSLTDGTATFTGGKVSNLNDPENPQDAATKSYADTIIAGLSGPGAPDTSVQFITTESSVWTTYTIGLDLGQAVVWSPDLDIFLATGDIGGTDGGFATSSDGITWTTITFVTGAVWANAAWSGNRFVAVGSDSTPEGIAAYSSNGTSWISVSTPTDNIWLGITFADSKFVVVGSDTGSPPTTNNYALYSTDGISWISTTTPNESFANVTYSSSLDLFVAVSTGTGAALGSMVITSPDGINWTSRSIPELKTWLDIAWSEELSLFVAVGLGVGSTDNRIMTSSNAITWATQTVIGDRTWGAITWSDEQKLFVVVTDDAAANSVMISADGFDWSTQTVPAGGDWLDVAYSPELNRFSAIGETTNLTLCGTIDKEFKGDATFTYTEGTNTLTVDTITDGTTTMTGGVISDLVNPTNSMDLATKDYVDSKDNMTITTITSVSNTTYTAAQMVDGLILRSGSAETLVDLTATAVDLVAAIPGAVVGSRALFSMRNISSEIPNVIIVAPNLGVTIHRDNTNILESIVVENNYQTNVEMIVENATSGSEAIKMVVLNTDFLDSGVNLSTFSERLFFTFKNFFALERLAVTKKYLDNFDPTTVSDDSDYTYSVENVRSGLVRRGGTLTDNRFDKFTTSTEFAENSFQSPVFKFVVQNVDPTYNITLTQGNGFFLEIGDFSQETVDSTAIIPPGKTAYMKVISSFVNGTGLVFIFSIV